MHVIFHLSFSASILFLSLRQSFQSLLWGLGVLSKRCVWDIQTLCLQCGYHPFLRPRPADSMQAFIVPSSLCFFDSDKPIQGRADDMEPVCHADLRIIVPVISFPQTTTIRHLRSTIWDILWNACMSSASPSFKNGEKPNCGQMGTYPNS